jgi:adenine-specific DNA-methyltransferase
MTVTEIRQILESPYDRKVWKGFLQTQFTNNKLNAEDRTISLSDKTLSKQCLSLGNYEINEYTKIGIFEVELNEKVNITRNRVALRNLIKDLTKQVAGAMVVFVQGDKWRFSYISKRKIKNKDTNEIQDKETAPKRYTYLFGKGEKALTAAIRFDKLIQKQQENIFQYLNLDDFDEAFSVEKLGKEFFANYKNAYEDFVQFLTGKRYAKKGSKYAEQVVSEPNWQLTALFGKDEKQARDFVKRMMGRIVFLYFIQKKGWLSVKQGKKWGEGNPDYLYDLFKKSKQKDDFYARELVPLFFTRLNNEDSENTARDERFPYLNGGLFDDTQDRKYNKLHLPEDVFERMFNTFNNYNFTIYEDAPDEHTVAVDPEMLGHIFENLLEDNKDKGAFYTPKEIVHYMCKESLKAYLFAQDEKQYADSLAKATIEKIIQQQELNEDETTFAEKNAYKIIDALESVKICDPAIGSGAFPMGLLQEIFNAQIYLQELKGFKKAKTDADIKKHIIEESIYGVDIDAGAVDIARLRFWLSLVVDEQEPQPLPNLDFKIICANTLIPLGEIKGLDMDAKASLAVKELEKIRHDFFNVSSESKLNLERQFKKVQTDLLSLRELSTKDNYEFYTKLYGFNPFDFQAAPCSWFDAWWMFGVKEGFDIIIGNPPYGAKLSAADKKLYTSIYKHQDYQLDTYLLFIEKSFQLMKKNAVNAFIIPNTWLINLKLEKFRKYIVEQNTILNIVHYHKSVFENAVVDTQVVLFQKQESANHLVNIAEYKEIENPVLTQINQDKWKKLNGEPINIFIDEASQAIIDIIKIDSLPLSSICSVISGIVPYEVGKGNPVQTKEMLDERIYDADHKIDDTYRELLRGKDINKYVTLWDGKRWIKYGDNLGAPRYSANFDLPAKIVIRQTSDRLIATLDTQKFVCMKNMHVINPKDENYNLKYVLAIINSKLMDFYYETLNPEKGEALAEVKKENVEKLLIKKASREAQNPFVNLVDYLLFTNHKESVPMLSHTENSRLSTHLLEVLNMMVYELYFEKHMKENEIDVLQFIIPKPIFDLKNKDAKAEVIKDFYLWYQKPENPVRQRMLLVETRSKDKIALINKSIQQ